jgi:hypothetical protein
VIVIDKLLAGGITWVLRRVADAVDAEMYDESALREELLAAQVRLELGEIGEQDLTAIEESVMARLREVRERKRGAEAPQSGVRYAVDAIEADAGEETPRRRPRRKRR